MLYSPSLCWYPAKVNSHQTQLAVGACHGETKPCREMLVCWEKAEELMKAWGMGSSWKNCLGRQQA